MEGREKILHRREWELFISIYNIKQGDELRFVISTFIHENLTVGHIRQLPGQTVSQCLDAQ
jgi:hypothetical protein